MSLRVRFLSGYLPVVEGTIGGKPRQNIMIDTGTSSAVLDAALALSLGLESAPATMELFDGTIPATGVWIPELQVGPVRKRSVPAIVRDLSYLRHFGIPIAAIVGLDVLGDASFRLDYDARRLVFGEIAAEGMVIPAGDDWPFVVVDAEVQKQRLRLLVDTGAAGLVLFDGHVTAALASYGMAKKASADNLGGQVPASALPELQLLVHGKRVRVDTAFLVRDGGEMRRFDGLLAIGALGFRILSYDHESRTLYLKR
jgi:predicted aspartyl protease